MNIKRDRKIVLVLTEDEASLVADALRFADHFPDDVKAEAKGYGDRIIEELYADKGYEQEMR